MGEIVTGFDELNSTQRLLYREGLYLSKKKEREFLFVCVFFYESEQSTRVCLYIFLIIFSGRF